MATSDTGAHWRPRVEDETLLRGLGRFVDDVAEPGQCHGFFVRSPHAFARIRSIDASKALRAPGVLAVLTAADLEAAGVGNVARVAPLAGKNGRPLFVPHRPSLARDRVMHVGEPVALVVANTRARAQDAAEHVAVDYEALAPAVALEAALAPGAPQLWPEAPGNVALDWLGPLPDSGENLREIEEILARAPRVARVRLVNQRIFGAPMEPRGATASYDAAAERYTLRAGLQGAGPLRDQMVGVMGLKREQLRVIADEVGGGFGLKTPAYPEYPALLVAARTIGRPVHWMSTRSEGFQSDNQARDAVTEAELALDESGRFLALRVRHDVNMGAYLSSVGAHVGTNSFTRCLPTTYAIPKIAVEVRCVFTNTLPTGPYRGAGRPEANYMVERLVEEAARVTGIDRVELRRRNFVPPSAMPYATAAGTTFDGGEFNAILDRALALADYRGFEKRRARSAASGRLRGFGISCFLEHSGAMPVEGATISFDGGETVTLGLGVHSTGQGHATVFPRLLASRLGLSPEHVRHRHGDSDFDIKGYASVGSRSAMTAGHAIASASDALLTKGRAIAAGLLEADEHQIAYRDGAFEVAGTNRRIPLFELAAKAREQAAKGMIAESLDTRATVETAQTFPNGCHIAEVEIDPDTGRVCVASYWAVDDCGNVLDHTIVEGQVQGGVAQGLGQVLLERTVYDSESGQLVTGTFMDYAIPRADEVPDVVGEVHAVPATTNPLGVKGVGEAGTTAALAAIMNAIIDAIPHGAGAGLDMPATPEKIWRACRAANAT